jgi:haloalkane dehalogenase
MSFVDKGPRSESAVLMLHGNPTWSFYYRNLIRELSGTRRCVAPDHIGMGLSEKPEDYNYTLATRIADIERLVVELGLKQIDLVVHDWGGAIGFGFAARHPQLIRRLVVLNTAAFTMNRIPARIALCKAAGIGPWIVRGLNGFAGPATVMAMNRRRLSTEEKNGYLYPYRSWADRVAVSAFVQDIPMNASHRTWETLKSAEAGLRQFRDRAALIVWGGRDFCFNDAFLARWQEELPSARVQRIADGGHYILEDVREEVVPEIGRFLTV